MSVTIYDLAREAGVGIGTVSRCLNNHPSVSERTRARVLAVMRRLHYQPHTHAQRLASRHTNAVAAVIPYSANYFFLQVLQGVQDRAAQTGYDLILYGVSSPGQVDYYLRRSLQRGRVDGVMFFSMPFPESFASRFFQMKLPVVLVDTAHPSFDSIRVENRHGALIVIRHLRGLGHRRIAMISACPESLPARERLEGYREAMSETGVLRDPELEIFPESRRLDGFCREAGRRSMRALLPRLRGPDPVTAVFVASDIQAAGVMEAARESGVRIPGDLACVGFDDIELAEHMQLTTMRQPMYDMGVLAFDHLLSRNTGSHVVPSVTSFLPRLIVRRSCGAGPGRNNGAMPDHALSGFQPGANPQSAERATPGRITRSTPA